MESLSVSPTERPFSVSPVNTIRRALRLRVQGAERVRLRVEIDLEHDHVLVFGLPCELDQDRVLRAAGGTPRGEDIDQNRLARFLRLGEGGRVERLPFFGCGGKRADQRGGGNDDKKERAQASHPSDLLALPQDPAAITAADRGPPITIA
jgi:hypothetical protein